MQTSNPSTAMTPDADDFVGLSYVAPPDDLRNLFGSAYHFTVRRQSYDDITRADIAQYRFMLSGRGHYRFHDGSQLSPSDISMIGPAMAATNFHLTEPAEVIGLSVMPLGWAALGEGDASALADNLSNRSDNAAYNSLLEQMRAAPDGKAAIALLWPFFSARLNAVPPGTARFIAATDAWLADDNNPRVDALVAATDLSARQVARLANRLYGGPPKLLARKYRALRCAAKILIDRQPWQDLCDDGTFYDQSHFIREIKHFIGLTPHQLMTDPTAVARLTLQRRAMSGQVAEINRIS